MASSLSKMCQPHVLPSELLLPLPLAHTQGAPVSHPLAFRACQGLQASPEHCPGTASASMVSEAVWQQCPHTPSPTLNQMPSHLSCHLHCHLRVSSVCKHIFISLKKEHFSVVCPMTACSLHLDLGNVPNRQIWSPLCQRFYQYFSEDIMSWAL